MSCPQSFRKAHSSTIVLNRSGKLPSSLKRFHRLEKYALTSVRCPSAERLGTTVLRYLFNGWGQPFYAIYQPIVAFPTSLFAACAFRAL